MKIAFVRVPKTASSAIVQEDIPEMCPGVLDLNYNGECYIKHNFPFHYDHGKYCSFFKNYNQHVASSVYNNLEDHDHLFYTQIRDPYDMACSLYFFLKDGNNKRRTRTSIVGSNVDVDHHNAQLIKDGILVDDFLQNMKHNQTFTHYYDDIKVDEFDCVGAASDMRKTKYLLRKMFNRKIKVRLSNVNPNKNIKEKYDFKFNRQMFEKLNEEEYLIFNNGMKKFEQLCSKYL